MIFFRRGCVGGVNFLFFFLHNDYLKPVFFYLAQRGERRFVVDIGSLSSSPTSWLSSEAPASSVLSSGSVGVVEAKLNVQDLLLTVRSLGVQFVVLVLFVLLSQNILFICVSFLPFGVIFIALTSLAQVEGGAFLFGLLSLPLVYGHHLGLFFLGSLSG